MFPINKNLWTSSYVVFTAGFASLLLAALLLGHRRRRAGAAGRSRSSILGVECDHAVRRVRDCSSRRSALIRVAGRRRPEIAVSRWAYLHWFAPFAAPKNASLLYALANLVVLFALLAWMYRRRIFLRV